MKLIFRTADKVTDPESAARVLSKYKNSEVEMSLDGQSFVGTLLTAKAEGGTLRLEFSWKITKDQQVAEVEHVERIARSKVGSMVRFRAGTDELVGILTGTTELPSGATIERYLNVPFMLSFAFSAEDQKPLIAFSKKSAIIGVPVPTNIVSMLPFGSDLPYEPHITVAYFPELTEDLVTKVMEVAKLVARKIGTFPLYVKRAIVFPTPQEDGTYPHVAEVQSEGLHDFHNDFIEGIELKCPGIVSLEFARENYRPHITLDYKNTKSVAAPIKEMVWTADYLTLNEGKDKKHPIPLSRTVTANTAAFVQVGDHKVPMKILGRREGEIRVRALPQDVDVFKTLEGQAIKLCFGTKEQKVDVVRLVELPENSFRISYRTLSSLLPKSAKLRMRQIAEMAGARGEKDIEKRLLSLSEEEDDDTDKEALGPGFEGTDSHIVTYTKAPQTQVIIKSPSFPRGLPLHERI